VFVFYDDIMDFFFFALFDVFFSPFLGRGYRPPTSSLTESLISLVSRKKSRRKKKSKKKTKFNKRKKRVARYRALSFFPSLSLSVLLDIKYTRARTHARETREDYKSNFFVSSL
jgi:hypothetical protein